MASFNRFFAVGYLAQDAEVKVLPNGTEIAEFCVYTKEYQGKGKELKTEFFDCSTFLPSVIESAKRGMPKGTQVYVEGRLQSSEYENKQGVKIRKWRVRVSDMRFMQPKNTENAEEMDNESSTRQAPRQASYQAPAAQPTQTVPDDDCPF